MYSPKLKDEQIKKLYQLAQKRNEPMTYLLREAVDEYLEKQSSCIDKIYPVPKEEIIDGS